MTISCPKCGRSNRDNAKSCYYCDQPLQGHGEGGGLDPSTASKDTEVKLQALQGMLSGALRTKYSKIPQDDEERIMDRIQKFFLKDIGSRQPIQSILKEAGILISRTFGFTEISIGLRDPKDGLYKYESFVGLRSETEQAYKKLAYTYNDMMDTSKFPRISISEYCDFFLGEFRPYQNGEEHTYGRPSLLGTCERKSPDNMIEGDYICTYMYGHEKLLIGWFEFARTRNENMPSRKELKWLEFFTIVLGKMIYERQKSDAGKRRI
mgnify:CR=1 FL=1